MGRQHLQSSWEVVATQVVSMVREYKNVSCFLFLGVEIMLVPLSQGEHQFSHPNFEDFRLGSFTKRQNGYMRYSFEGPRSGTFCNKWLNMHVFKLFDSHANFPVMFCTWSFFGVYSLISYLRVKKILLKKERSFKKWKAIITFKVRL